jgi:hypothetical protein
MVSFRVRDLDRIAANHELPESRSRLIRSLIPTAGSLAYLTLREIRSNSGNLKDETLHARLRKMRLTLSYY